MNTVRRSCILPGSLLLAAALTLSACGDADTDAKPGDRPSVETTAAAPVDGPVEYTQVAEFSSPRLRAEPAPMAVLLDEEVDVVEWLEPFGTPEGLMADVTESVGAVLEPDVEVYGLLLGAGCERPSDYTLTRADGEITLRVAPVTSDVQCLVATTYLAVVTVDETA